MRQIVCSAFAVLCLLSGIGPICVGASPALASRWLSREKKARPADSMLTVLDLRPDGTGRLIMVSPDHRLWYSIADCLHADAELDSASLTPAPKPGTMPLVKIIGSFFAIALKIR